MLITHAVDQTTDNRRVKWRRNCKNCLESTEMLRGYLHCPEAAGTPPGSPSRGSSAPAGSRGPAGL